jgi:hypothetical protein
MIDDVSGDTMFVIDESDNGGAGSSSFWISDDAGLGVDYIMVTNSGDRLVWSS